MAYGMHFNVSPEHMGDLYPGQVKAMDAALEQMESEAARQQPRRRVA